MANTSSAKKQYRKSIRQRSVNKNNCSKIKTLEKKILTLVAAGQKTEAVTLFPSVQSVIMQGVTKKVLKLNTASRKVSRISRLIKECVS